MMVRGIRRRIMMAKARTMIPHFFFNSKSMGYGMMSVILAGSVLPCFMVKFTAD
jgi:hypothetical protein